MRDELAKGRTEILPRRILFHVLSVSLLFLLWGFLLFSSTGRDDAYTTYWPSFTLSEYGEILNYNGDRVEQSSSLLQVLLLSALHAMTGQDMASLGGATAISFGIVSVLMIYLLTRRILPQAAYATALLTATSVYFLYWSFSGMESSLVPAVTIALILSYSHFLESPGRPGPLLLLCCATALLFVSVRPEMTIILPVMAFGYVLITAAGCGFSPGSSPDLRRARDRSIILLILSLFACGAVFVFRISYFTSWFPQPVYAKSPGLSLQTIAQGLNYLKIHLFSGPPAAILTLAMILGLSVSASRHVKLSGASPPALLSFLFILLYGGMVVLAGGDWMEGGRFIAHLLPVAMMFLVLGLYYLMKVPRLIVPSLFAVFLLEVWMGLGFARAMSTGMPLWAGMKSSSAHANKLTGSSHSWFELTNRIHLRDIPLTDRLNTIVEKVWRYKNDTVTVMSGQMGFIAYYVAWRHFGHIRFIDRHGLTDRAFSDCALFDRIPRTPLGIALSFRTRDIKTYLQDCGIPMPDVVYDIFRAPQGLDLISSQGYQIVYLQYGPITANSESLPGVALSANQFIAVRVDLEGALAGYPKESLNFSEIEF